MNTEDLGNQIQQRRKQLGISQLDAAELSGVSVHTLSNIESGKGNPTLEVLSKVLTVLGLRLAVEVAP